MRFLTFYLIPAGIFSMGIVWFLLVALFSDPFSDQSDIVSWWRKRHPKKMSNEEISETVNAYWKAKREGKNPPLIDLRDIPGPSRRTKAPGEA